MRRRASLPAPGRGLASAWAPLATPDCRCLRAWGSGRRASSASSVAARRVETVGHRLALLPRAQVGKEQIKRMRIVGRRIIDRRVRADDQIARGPQAVALGDRLGREYIQYRAGQVAVVQQV